ncbi:hypothetical protein SNEBB_000761 [Seison nebaliae]|nr:hypothetical protein SNEBB_000761 [Seison nebaliae]
MTNALKIFFGIALFYSAIHCRQLISATTHSEEVELKLVYKCIYQSGYYSFGAHINSDLLIDTSILNIYPWYDNFQISYQKIFRSECDNNAQYATFDPYYFVEWFFNHYMQRLDLYPPTPNEHKHYQYGDTYYLDNRVFQKKWNLRSATEDHYRALPDAEPGSPVDEIHILREKIGQIIKQKVIPMDAFAKHAKELHHDLKMTPPIHDHLSMHLYNDGMKEKSDCITKPFLAFIIDMDQFYENTYEGGSIGEFFEKTMREILEYEIDYMHFAEADRDVDYYATTIQFYYVGKGPRMGSERYYKFQLDAWDHDYSEELEKFENSDFYDMQRRYGPAPIHKFIETTQDAMLKLNNLVRNSNLKIHPKVIIFVTAQMRQPIPMEMSKIIDTDEFTFRVLDLTPETNNDLLISGAYKTFVDDCYNYLQITMWDPKYFPSYHIRRFMCDVPLKGTLTPKNNVIINRLFYHPIMMYAQIKYSGKNHIFVNFVTNVNAIIYLSFDKRVKRPNEHFYHVKIVKNENEGHNFIDKSAIKDGYIFITIIDADPDDICQLFLLFVELDCANIQLQQCIDDSYSPNPTATCSKPWDCDVTVGALAFGITGLKCTFKCSYCKKKCVGYECQNYACEDGYTLKLVDGKIICYQCPPFTWGYMCGRKCGFCAKGVACHEKSGLCPDGCAPGYGGTYCFDRVCSDYDKEQRRSLSVPSEDCSTYLICVANDRDILMSCPPFMEFSEKAQVCITRGHRCINPFYINLVVELTKNIDFKYYLKSPFDWDNELHLPFVKYMSDSQKYDYVIGRYLSEFYINERYFQCAIFHTINYRIYRREIRYDENNCRNQVVCGVNPTDNIFPFLKKYRIFECPNRGHPWIEYHGCISNVYKIETAKFVKKTLDDLNVPSELMIHPDPDCANKNKKVLNATNSIKQMKLKLYKRYGTKTTLISFDIVDNEDELNSFRKMMMRKNHFSYENHHLLVNNKYFGGISRWLLIDRVRNYYGIALHSTPKKTRYINVATFIDGEMVRYMRIMFEETNKRLGSRISINKSIINRALAFYINSQIDMINRLVTEEFGIRFYLVKIVIIEENVTAPWEKEMYTVQKIDYYFYKKVMQLPNIIDMFGLWTNALHYENKDFEDIHLFMLYSGNYMTAFRNTIHGVSFATGPVCEPTLSPNLVPIKSLLVNTHMPDFVFNSIITAHEIMHILGLSHTEEYRKEECLKDEKGHSYFMKMSFNHDLHRTISLKLSSCGKRLLRANPYLKCFNESFKVKNILEPLKYSGIRHPFYNDEKISIGTTMLTPDIHCRLGNGLNYFWNRDSRNICEMIICQRFIKEPRQIDDLYDLSEVTQLFNTTRKDEETAKLYTPDGTPCHNSEGYVGRCRLSDCIIKGREKNCLYDVDLPTQTNCPLCHKQLNERMSCLDTIKYNYMKYGSLKKACEESLGCCNLCEKLQIADFADMCRRQGHLLCGMGNGCSPSPDRKWFKCKCYKRLDQKFRINLQNSENYLNSYCTVIMHPASISTILKIIKLQWERYLELMKLPSDLTKYLDILTHHSAIDWEGKIRKKRHKLYKNETVKIEPVFTRTCQYNPRCRGLYGFKADNLERVLFKNSTREQKLKSNIRPFGKRYTLRTEDPLYSLTYPNLPVTLSPFIQHSYSNIYDFNLTISRLLTTDSKSTKILYPKLPPLPPLPTINYRTLPPTLPAWLPELPPLPTTKQIIDRKLPHITPNVFPQLPPLPPLPFTQKPRFHPDLPPLPPLPTLATKKPNSGHIKPEGRTYPSLPSLEHFWFTTKQSPVTPFPDFPTLPPFRPFPPRPHTRPPTKSSSNDIDRFRTNLPILNITETIVYSNSTIDKLLNRTESPNPSSKKTAIIFAILGTLLFLGVILLILVVLYEKRKKARQVKADAQKKKDESYMTYSYIYQTQSATRKI